MKKSILLALTFLLSSSSMADNVFKFPVKSMSVKQGFEVRYILKSSKRMHELADEINLDCQSFMAEVSFFKKTQSGELGAPVEAYNIDHYSCYQTHDKISALLKANKSVCVALDLENMNGAPEVLEEKCEAPGADQ